MRWNGSTASAITASPPKHFHEHLKASHILSWSYTWTKNCLGRGP
jgi:hypothetical protein